MKGADAPHAACVGQIVECPLNADETEHLVALLAGLLPSPEIAQGIAADVGIETSHLAWRGRADRLWAIVVEEAMFRGVTVLRNLVWEARIRWPNDPRLCDMIALLDRSLAGKVEDEHEASDLLENADIVSGLAAARLSVSEAGLQRRAGLWPDMPERSSKMAALRLKVFESLLKLLPGQFDEVLFRLEVPMHQVLPATVSLSSRASELVTIAEQAGQVGLERLDEVLTAVLLRVGG